MEAPRNSSEEVKPVVAAEEGRSELKSSTMEDVTFKQQEDSGSGHGGGLSAEKPHEDLCVNNTRSMPTPAAGLNAMSMPPAQLTIFYGGNISVFDGISPEKVHELLLIAAAAAANSSDKKNIADPAASPALTRSPSFQSTTALTSPGGQLQFVRQNSFCRLEADIPIARRHSLQRFLEKRRDRFLNKSPYRAQSADKKTDDTTTDPSAKTSPNEGSLEKNPLTMEKINQIQ